MYGTRGTNTSPVSLLILLMGFSCLLKYHTFVFTNENQRKINASSKELLKNDKKMSLLFLNDRLSEINNSKQLTLKTYNEVRSLSNGISTETTIQIKKASNEVGYLQLQIADVTGGALQPWRDGQCWFHSQVPHRNDVLLFQRMGGKVKTDQCNLKSPLLQNDAPSEAQLCPCTAPGPEAFNKSFLEIGALDGQFLSNLLFFESQMGWRGMCIEGSPHNYKSLVVNRPNCININGVVSRSIVESENKSATFFTFVKEGSWERAMSCILGSSLCATRDTANDYAKSIDGQVEENIVQGYLLSDLFAMAGFSTMGWIMMDVEGAEYEVIKTMDFDRVKAELVTFEGGDVKVKELLASNGYQETDPLGLDAAYLYVGTQAFVQELS